MRQLYLLFGALLAASAQDIAVFLPEPQQEASAPALRPEDLCSLSGQVLNAATGEFVGKASLRLMRSDPPRPNSGPPPSYTATSDPEGKFVINGIEPGKYYLSFTRNGFVSSPYGARGLFRPGTPLTFERAKNIRDVVVRMTPHGVITGRIVDADGDPVVSANVQLARTVYSQGKRQLAPFNSATTNDLGEYRFFGIAPGKYFVCATLRRMMDGPNIRNRPAASQGDEDHVPTYFPGVIDPGSAVQVEVTAGGTASNINWKLSKARTLRVRGRVSQNVVPGNPTIRIQLVPRSDTGAIPFMAGGAETMRQPDRNGNFEIAGVSPGSYVVMAIIFTNDKNASAGVPVEVGSTDVENVNLEVVPGFAVTGTIRVDGETKENLSNLALQLLPKETGYTMFIGSRTKLNSDGTFRIEDVTSNRYNLIIPNLPEGFYIKSVRSGETDVLASGYDARGGAPGPLAVVLSPNAGLVTGTVQDSATQKPAAGSTVVLIPQETERRTQPNFYRQAATDQAGNFVVKGVVPGEYKVFAWEDLEPGMYMDPEFIKPVESKGESVSVKESGRPSVQLKLIPVG